jgi:hypothetical protein
MRRLLDLNHPFFIPLWRRGLIVAACLGWAVVEIVGQNTVWALLFGGIGLYAGYVFFFDFQPRDPDDKGGP